MYPRCEVNSLGLHTDTVVHAMIIASFDFIMDQLKISLLIVLWII